MLRTLPALPDALCASGQYNPELWHPDRANPKQEALAKGICFRCPVMIACLSFALRSHPVSGIWGGTTETQRRALVDAVEQRTLAS